MVRGPATKIKEERADDPLPRVSIGNLRKEDVIKERVGSGLPLAPAPAPSPRSRRLAHAIQRCSRLSSRRAGVPPDHSEVEECGGKANSSQKLQNTRWGPQERPRIPSLKFSHQVQSGPSRAPPLFLLAICSGLTFFPKLSVQRKRGLLFLRQSAQGLIGVVGFLAAAVQDVEKNQGRQLSAHG